MGVLDYHVHTDYSDGDELESMVRAMERSELTAMGLADHCNVTSEITRRDRDYYLHESYLTRREEINRLAGRYDVQLFDAVEVDYYIHDESNIETFLDDAGFDYSLGSVHHIHDRHMANMSFFRGNTPRKRKRFVNDYVQSVVSLIESELFDIAAHIDVIERYPPFRNLITEDHYERVADAIECSRTIPEINVGRVFGEYGKTHPKPEFIEYLLDRDVEFTYGSDAHSPETVEAGAEYALDLVENEDVSFTTLDI